MKFNDVPVPTVARGRVPSDNPFIEVIDAMAAEFANGKVVAKQFIEQGDSTDVGRWFRLLTAAGKAHGLTVRRTIDPKLSTSATPGVDDKAERTVTFWLATPDGRGKKKKA